MGRAIAEAIGAQFAESVGAANVLTDPAKRTFFSTDLAGGGKQTGAVIQIGSVEELAHVAAQCSEQGIVMIPRGGGFSYTGGYGPDLTGLFLAENERQRRRPGLPEGSSAPSRGKCRFHARTAGLRRCATTVGNARTSSQPGGSPEAKN